jgi:phosphatidylglycerol lysyltransferase
MRRALAWIPGLGALAVLLNQSGDLTGVPATLALAQPRWLLIAVMAHVITWYLLASVYRWTLRAMDVESRSTELLPVIFSAMYVTATGRKDQAIPLIVEDAAGRGHSESNAGAAVLLARFIHLVAFVPLLLCGLLRLLSTHALGPWEMLALTVIIVLTTGLSINAAGIPAVVVALGGVSNAIARFFGRRAVYPERWLESGSDELRAAAHGVAYHPLMVARAAAFALAVHALSMFGLFAIFTAMGQEVGVATLITGHGLALMAFAFTSLPPASFFQESVTALAFYALGFPLDVSLVAAVAYRILWFWTPVAFGALVMRGERRYGLSQRSNAEAWSVLFVAVTTWIMGVVNVITAMLPALRPRLEIVDWMIPRYAREDARLTSIALGFTLIMLAGSLSRRKRMAWILSLAALIASAVVHLLKGLDVEFSLMAGALAVWLYHLGPHFHARSDPPSVTRGLRALGLSVLFVLLYGGVGFWLLDRHFREPFQLGHAITQTAWMALWFFDSQVVPTTRIGRFFADSIYVVSAFASVYSLLMLLRPVLPRGGGDPSDRERARAIVEQWGCSTMAHFSLLPDKTWFFSPGGSVVAYGVKGHTAVVLGDPIGPPDDLSAAIAAFRDFAAGNDWDVAFYQTRPDTLEAYKALGFAAVSIGNEAVVDVKSFSTAGKAGQSLRTAVNKLTRLGYKTELHEPPLSDAFIAELRQVSDEWLTRMHGTEKHFSLGAFETEYVRHCPILAVHAPDGAITAFANIIPEYRLNETTIDMMRRRMEIENGTMDVLFVALLKNAQEKGFDTFNLGLSPLAGVGEHEEDPAAERAIHYIYEHLNQFYNFKGLHSFKEKWHPSWSPRYLILPRMAALPSVAVALIRVHSGDHFVIDYCRDLLAHRPAEPPPKPAPPPPVEANA